MDNQKDTYLTIAAPVETIYKEKSSKFLTYAWHVTDAEQVRELLDGLRKRYYDATHHCYAYRIGYRGEQFRANDDGEPSGTAGKPILGQLLSRDVTDCLVVVVRYFGGTKLGVSGLIDAYKTSTAMVLDEAEIVERTIDREITITFPYASIGEVMKIIKEEKPKVREQIFDNTCRIE
ncbi:MAG: YigZ family protein, partial [Tidjanibacter sp.]|nr:YigZ family protein [Tidjanibacter sp.]